MGHVLKKGKSVYEVMLFDDGTTELWEWVVTQIKTRHNTKKVVYMIHKSQFTWVKKSTKHFDYGWADGIRDYNKDWFYLEEGLPDKYSFTKAGAYKKSIPYIQTAYNKLGRKLGFLKGKYTKLKSNGM